MKKKTSDKHPDYYEAILQLRPYKEEVYDLVHVLVDKREDVFIAKEKLLKSGIDLYISSQKFTRHTLGPQLKRKFKGSLTITKTLYGRHRMSSKLIYRATVLFRLKEE